VAIPRDYFRYWGKAGDETDGDIDWHPLVYHGLDVAASARVLMRSQPAWLDSLSRSCELDPAALYKWISFLMAIHDIGKFGQGFQSLRPELQRQLQGIQTVAAYDTRHDTLGYALLLDSLQTWLDRDPDDDLELDLLQPWVSAVTGHHGRPPVNKRTKPIVLRHFANPAREAARQFVQDIRHLLMPDWCLPEPAPGVAEQQWRCSWLVAGLAVASDWLGSNRRWFAYHSPDLPLACYWHQVALPIAERAVRESGLAAPRLAKGLGFSSLFHDLADRGTPLQIWADTVTIASSPQLIILEELTGGGKTEAGLTLAGRLLGAGQGQGIYFALPTMATADAMHDRLCRANSNDTQELWQRFFTSDDVSMILAHSAAATKAKLDSVRNRDAGYDPQQETPSASQHCTAWLSDSRKKALLADFGIGTLDQALLGVLPLKHQSLRLLGLSTKVLLVDEVHACDCYMGELLQRLLRFHAGLGGSAILLSATLPIEQRERLVAAFAAGAGYDAPTPTEDHYPLASHLHADGLDEAAIQPRECASRSIAIDPITEDSDVFERLARTLQRGGCAVWVRNTVADAIDAWSRWNAQYHDRPAILFHARFALGDRLAIAEIIKRTFGPDSASSCRAGRLVIATQVVEQSLDIDFDDMVTDLAPIDLVVQRAGRLQRHARDALGNRADSEARGGARLGVHMPEPTPDAPADWFKRFLSKAAMVYPDHGKLWLTARWLTEHGAFDLARQARDMIESVYGERGYEHTPEALRSITDAALGQCQADRGTAWITLLNFELGYDPTSQSWPEEDEHADIATRLGEKTVRLRLARVVGTELRAWASADASVEWALSELTVPRRLVAAESERYQGLIEKARATMRDEGRYCLILPLEPAGDEWQGWATNERQQDVRVVYSANTGLRILTEGIADESDH
jgi:CRISPR-associated endonuclease/helicase Cas3